ncbi:MAG: glycosyltransferase family 2 protein [Rubripirellula sp.]|nr:glycosyltransferase family 2 protein [Rubripirellula sp.]
MSNERSSATNGQLHRRGRVPISIVATMYRSAPYVREFYIRAVAAAKALVGDHFEIVLVNDGSPDSSLEIAKQIAKADDRIVVVDFSRNFGHHPAMMAGLLECRGDLVYLLDIDLEEQPEWLLPFFKRMHEETCDVVYGVQKNRKGNAFERLSGALFYCFLNMVLGFEHPRNITTARLMTRRYVDALNQHHEQHIVISALMQLTGFVQVSETVTKMSKGSTSYNLQRKISLVLRTMTSFSARPLIFVLIFGLSVSIVSFLFGAWLIFCRLFFSAPLAGWTSVMVSVWLLGGIVLMVLGLVGLYISTIFEQVKKRPRWIVREIIHGNKTQTDQVRTDEPLVLQNTVGQNRHRRELINE